MRGRGVSRRMGKEAACRVVVDGQAWEGKALLETDELVLRGGPARIALPRRGLSGVTAVDGELRFVADGRAFALALGKAAESWAKEILHPKTRIEKLGVKEGQRVALVGASDAALAAELDQVGAKLVDLTAKDIDVVFLQVDAPAGLVAIASAAKRIARDGAVWVLSPRGVAGLKDTDVMAAAKKAGLVDVKVVRFSETHSANKFVVPKAKR